METSLNVAVIVAHPDDETIWVGGTLLINPQWHVYITSLCRGNDKDRAPKFYRILHEMGAQGNMGNLDDSPELLPMEMTDIMAYIVDLLPAITFDLIITHHPKGEYTRHLRHEEISQAVIRLWKEGKINTGELWCFAYEDGNREYYPRPILTADIVHPLEKEVWLNKYRLVTEVYGFESESWEAHTTPQTETFWRYTKPDDASQLLINIKNNEGISPV